MRFYGDRVIYVRCRFDLTVGRRSFHMAVLLTADLMSGPISNVFRPRTPHLDTTVFYMCVML